MFLLFRGTHKRDNGHLTNTWQTCDQA